MVRRVSGWFIAASLAIALVLGLVWLASSRAGVLADAPPQPTGLTAFNVSGQTFITWTERADLSGESYRIYRFDQPITSANLTQALLLYEVWEGSGRFYADRYNVEFSGVWQARYVGRYVITDGGTQLPEGTGLLVWTLAPAELGDQTSGTGYYAVTTVSPDGVENRSVFSTGNSAGPLAESVDDPLPVEILTGAGGRGHIFCQFMDLHTWNPTFHAPNATNAHYGLDPDDPALAHAIQYAYTYSVSEPDPANCGGSVPTLLPAFLNLHGWGENSYGPFISAADYYCAVEIRPIDVSETWFFGFARYHDYRQSSIVGAGDVVVNYTEQRILRMVYDLLRHLTLGAHIDANRIYVWGHSMGGSGTLALALRYPGVFAAAYASEPMTNYRTSGDDGGTDWRSNIEIKWGSPALNLPVQIDAPGSWASHLQAYNGTGVWDWQNHQANLQTRLGDEMVPLGIAHGRNDQVIEWSTQGQPTYAAFNAGLRAWGGTVTNDDHSWLSFQGLPPNLAPDASLVPFAGFQAVCSESLPGLSNASADSPLPPAAPSAYNQTIEYSASGDLWDGLPIDTVSSWRISLRTTDGSNQTVDVTPRRLQALHITAGASYTWENRRIGDDALVAAGSVVADNRGLVTIPAVAVSSTGNRLLVRQTVGGPTATPVASITPSATATRTPTTGATPRPLPDTINGIHVFNDQLSSLNPQLTAFSARHYVGAQKMTRDDADALRAANPNFIILHYRLGDGLGYRTVTGDCQPNGAWLQIINGDWTQEWPGDDVVQDAWFYTYNGERVYHCGWGWFLMQLDDPGWRTWWSSAVITQLLHNDSDGLFADSLSVPNYLGGDQYDPPLPGVDAAFEAAWTTRIQDFMTYIQGRFAGRYYLVPNVGDWVNGRDAVDYSIADGVMIEGFGYDVWENYGEADWVLEMNRALNLVNLGKVIIAQSYRVDNANLRLFTLGSYLLIKGNRTYVNLELGQEPEWWPEYDIPIGAPLVGVTADMLAMYNTGWGVYRRDYTNGLVLVNAGDSTRIINLGATFYSAVSTGGGTVPEDGVLPGGWLVEYEPVTQITLAPGRAAILLRIESSKVSLPFVGKQN